MARNRGSEAEDDFSDLWAKVGKRAYLCWLVDAAEIKGRTGRIGLARAQPSDALLVFDGRTEFAEVKSTEDHSAFHFKLLRKSQSAAATMILAAGGTYIVYLRSWVQGCWYRVPYTQITATKATGKASIPWHELEPFKWNLPTPT
ncbi:hypothetical protein IZ6_24740 [Terrihabitans soli]|uniref:Holliday junction resolvase n=1 Tax=Terrihabitans soli TaxID=708113 RepID=A0A6S6QRR1_9HYPH|nr:hypothetical protein IZ6_24740 [Terrihabitans soli]